LARAGGGIASRRAVPFQGVEHRDLLAYQARPLTVARKQQGMAEAGIMKSDLALRSAPLDDRSREIAWLRENRNAYLNKWVSLDGDRLILADDDAAKVYQAAKAEGIAAPVVVHVLPEDELPFVGGW
jgi:hypothetical protein